MRDFQRSKVYKWEQKYIWPMDNGTMSEEDFRSMVEFVWLNEGRCNPPKVLVDSKMKAANANRFRIKASPSMLRMSVLCHEIAHSFLHTLDEDAKNDEYHGHNEIFVKKYVDLLAKYMRVPLPLMLWSLKESKVKVAK